MAVRTSCPRCGKRFSAPDSYLGKKEACPRCGYRFILRSREEELEIREQEQRRRREEENDVRRLELIERQEKKKELSGQPYYERYQTGLQAVRHYHPNAPSRFLRLRALSDLLILSAYLVLMLVVLGAGLMVYLAVQGGAGVASLLLGLVACALLAALSFLFLKYLGEMAFVIADLTDLQNDVVQLLLDLRENTDAPEAQEAQES
ncbi:MAG: hypothetical protein JXA90_07300 [Planctomycetes bacterium]|nr:hypothetical protein [Planctomycetota bacterium]